MASDKDSIREIKEELLVVLRNMKLDYCENYRWVELLAIPSTAQPIITHIRAYKTVVRIVFKSITW